MATTTWQGDDGTNPTLWNVAANWDTNAVPTAADDVVLPAINNACTINAAAVCRSFDASAYTGTLTHNAAITLTIGDATAGAGNVALAFNTTANMTYSVSAVSCAISYVSTSTTVQTVNYNGHISGSTTFNATSGGSWQLTGTWGQDAATTRVITLTKGTLDTNGQTCYWGSFSSDNNNTRVLTLGASSIRVATASVNAWRYVGTGSTLTANTATIELSGASSYFTSTPTSYGGEVKFTGGGTQYISNSVAAITFANLTITGTAAKTDQFYIITGHTVTGTLNIDGNSAINRVLFRSDTLGTARTLTLTGATITGCTNVDFRDIAFVSTGAIDFTNGGANWIGDCGGNSVSGGGTVTFTTADDWYWNGSGTRNFSDYTYWYTATNGGGSQMASTRCPLPQDTCYFDADSIDGATTVDQDLPRIPAVDFTGVSAMSFHMNNVAQQSYGNFILVSNVAFTTWNDGATFTLIGLRGSHTFDSNNKNTGSTSFSMYGATYTLGNHYSASDDGISINNGTLDLNDYNITVRSFNVGSGVNNLICGSGTISMSLSASVNSSATITPETSTISLAASAFGARTFDFGGKTWYDITILGGGTLLPTIGSSNTFNTFTINAPKTVKFTSGTTQTVNSLVIVNNGTNRVTLSSVTADSVATISDANGGTNENDYLDVVDVNATQENTFYYGANGTEDNSANWYATPGGVTVIPLRCLMGVGV